MPLQGLYGLSCRFLAQNYLSHIRINVVGSQIREFESPCFLSAFTRLRALKVVEINPITHQADIFVCYELGQYLLRLPELDHVACLTLASPERKIREKLRAGFARLASKLLVRNKEWLLRDH